MINAYEIMQVRVSPESSTLGLELLVFDFESKNCKDYYTAKFNRHKYSAFTLTFRASD